jgi:hypothetical protein
MNSSINGSKQSKGQSNIGNLFGGVFFSYEQKASVDQYQQTKDI